MSPKKNYRAQERDDCAVEANKPGALVQIRSVTIWQPLRGGTVVTDATVQDELCGVTNIGGYIKEKLQGCNIAATSAPDLHKRKPSRRKREPRTCQQVKAMADQTREKYTRMANEQAARPYYDANATMSSSDTCRLFSDASKLWADEIENIADADPVLCVKAAKKMRSKERKGYGVLCQIGKKRAGVCPHHATAYIPGEQPRSAVKTYRGLANIASKAVRLVTELETASTKEAA